MNQRNLWLCLVLSWLVVGCQQNTSESSITSEPTKTKASHVPGALPDWAKNAAIYEVNTRQSQNTKDRS